MRTCVAWQTGRRFPTRLVGVLAAFALTAAAAGQPAWMPREAADQPRAAAVPEGLEGVAIEQKLGGTVALDLAVRDEQGHETTLGDVIGGKPAILALVYYECPMLCTLELNGLLRSARALKLDAGEDFRIVALSFDPGEGPELAAKKKEIYVKEYGRDGAGDGWRFLTAGEEVVAQVARAVGFRYRYDEKRDLYSHASGIVLLTPAGTVSRYFYGVDYAPRDLRLGLVEASDEKVGTLADQVLLFCFHYDPSQGKYTFAVMGVLRIMAALTLAAIVLFLGTSLYRERRQRRVAVSS